MLTSDEVEVLAQRVSELVWQRIIESRKRDGVKRKRPVHARSEALVREFRQDWADSVQPGFLWPKEIPASELLAASKFLEAQDWGWDRTQRLITLALTDVCEPQGPRKWTGWAAVIRSLNKLWEQQTKLLNLAREKGVVV